MSRRLPDHLLRAPWGTFASFSLPFGLKESRHWPRGIAPSSCCMREGWIVSPRKSRRKPPCLSSTSTSTPARASRNPKTAPAGLHPAMQQPRSTRPPPAGLAACCAIISRVRFLPAAGASVGAPPGQYSRLLVRASEPNKTIKMAPRARSISTHPIEFTADGGDPPPNFPIVTHSVGPRIGLRQPVSEAHPRTRRLSG